MLQEFGFSDLGEIQFEEDLCLDVSSSKPKSRIRIYGCHGLGGNQKWEYNNKVRYHGKGSSLIIFGLQTHEMKHSVSGLCLTVADDLPVVSTCDSSSSQSWLFSRHYTPKSKRTA